MKPKFNFINARLAEIKRSNIYRHLLDNKVSGPYIFIKGKKFVNLSSNDYLGLGYTKISPTQVQSSSRLVAGNDKLFKKLEFKLAKHKHQESALTFPTGYMANLGIISVLPQKEDLVLSDELNHASIIDSCRLTHAKKTIYKHNNMQDLEKKLKKDGRRKFVVTEGIFSMNGDFSELKEISDLCEKHGAFLILDDAHGDFVIGTDGQGSAEYLGVSKRIDVYVSSLSKGLGAFGGYVASKKEVVDLAINTSRPFIYTSALPNFLIQVALDKMSSDRESSRIKLWKNTHVIRKGLESLGYQIHSQSQVIPIIIGSEKKAVEFGQYLSSEGIFVQPIRYPTVELGSARIRISITSWLTDKNIAKSLYVLEKAGKKFGII